MNTVIATNIALIGLGCIALFFMRRLSPSSRTIRVAVGGLLGVNGLSLLSGLAMVLLAFGIPTPVLAQTAGAATSPSGAALVGAGLSTGLACIGAGIGVGIAGAAAIGAITEKPEFLGRTLIFVGLAEGIAIYGLIISFMVLNA